MIRRYLIPVIACAFSIMLSTGCNVVCSINASCDKGGDSSSGTSATPVAVVGTTPDGNGTTPATPSAPQETVTTYTDHPGFDLARLTPEAISNNFLKAAGYDDARNTDAYLGVVRDDLVQTFGTALGGIDFLTVSRRDPITKAQTLLISRLLAMLIAKERVSRELAFQQGWEPGTNVVFTKADILVDRPGDVTFDDQIKEIFWQFYSRPPASNELSAVKTVWQDAFDAESTDKPQRAWMAILYAIMAAQEFWHI